MERRTFLAASAAVAAGAATLPPAAAQQFPAPPGFLADGDMKYRALGNTGQKVSIIGIGGYHLGRPSAEIATRIVRTALDRGINFCDNCWDYNGGESEVRLGEALRDGYRDKAFLMTKIDGRDAKSAMSQLEESLRRLQTDHLDLLQFHEVIRMDDPERIFAAGGALEAVTRAREQGKLRYIGFTGHKSPAIHRHMFEVAAAHKFHFDTVQMPLNVMDAHHDSFEQNVLPIALKAGTGVLGMKPMGDPFILHSNTVTAMEALHYAMSLPVGVTITGIDSMDILDQAFRAIATFTPLDQRQRMAILDRTKLAAGGGEYEKYKSSHHFDGTVQHPEWLG